MLQALTGLLLLVVWPGPVGAGELRQDLGRNEVRIWSAPFVLEGGVALTEAGIPDRLERLGYNRVRGRRPKVAGEYFWGFERFWIHRRAFRWNGSKIPGELIGLRLDRDTGRLLGFLDGEEMDLASGSPALRLEPELLSESLAERRARRPPVEIDGLPDHVWKAVLAAEDHRFFQHEGVDARGVARAMLKNALAGGVVQGGSTITQQLIKTRDLSPKRTVGRKVSEAIRALALEEQYEKREILEAYLDHVYFGHRNGLALYGYGAGARAWFGKPPRDLTLSEAAAMAAMIQGPNRLTPTGHRERLTKRWEWVLSRLEELGWAKAVELQTARRGGLPKAKSGKPSAPLSGGFLDWLRQEAGGAAQGRIEDGRGVVIQSTLDPLLQDQAETVVATHLANLRKSHRRLRDRPLSAALVALDGRTGAVVAYVGGDPRAKKDAFDRGRRAQRQPGSTVKPLVLLEAFESCGDQRPLYPARRVSDRALRIELPTGPWEPMNFDRDFRPSVDLREATVRSLNIPFVRAARHCGFEETAERLRRVGLDLPEPAPPSFVLGAVEASPLQMASAYSVFANDGRWRPARPFERIETPSRRRLANGRSRSRKVVQASTAFLIRDLLKDSVARGTSRGAAIDGLAVWAKTGTTRDAWMVGGVGSLVVTVWVGLDDGSSLDLGGSQAAAPLFRRFVDSAGRSRPWQLPAIPDDVVRASVDDRNGLRVRQGRHGSHSDLFREGRMPPRRRLLLPDEPVRVID